MRVDFRHNQRDICIIAIERTIIDHNAAGRSRLWGCGFGRLRTDGKQSQIPALEIKASKGARAQALVAEGHLGAHGLRACQCDDVIHGKAPLKEDAQHGPPDCARRPNDSDTIAHDVISYVVSCLRCMPFWHSFRP